MAQFITINRKEMESFLTDLGFQEIPDLPHTTELVMGKIIAPSLCLRVYTSVVGETTRANGKDAIRCAVFHRSKITGTVTHLAGEKRVHRVVNWRKNLASRIETMESRLPDLVFCPQCAEIMQIRENRSNGNKFWGCTDYRNGCRGTRPYTES